MPIKITGDQTHALQGTAPQGSTLEVLDLTYASANRLSLDQYAPAGPVGADGKFSLPAADYKEGDYVRLRASDANGVVQSVVTVRIDAQGVEDTTNAPFVGRRLAMYDAGNGKAVVTQTDKVRPLSEPFATLRVTNSRTGASVDVRLDADGLFPKEVLIDAAPGDAVQFAVTDGKNNTDFALTDGAFWKVVGKRPHANDLPDPPPLDKAMDSRGRPMIGMLQFLGQAYVDGVSEDDVCQRFIGDCYLPAALGSIARLCPDVIQNMCRRQDDGTFVVTFKERTSAGYADRELTLDTDLYVDSSDAVVYGGGGQDLSVERMELWFPMIEKAYAAWAGGYAYIEGGFPSTVFTAVFGKSCLTHGLSDASEADNLWSLVTRSVDKKLPSALGTTSDASFYEGTGLDANHAYSVLGYRMNGNVREVEVRNPWGNSEPGMDGNDDGEFWMPVERAAEQFSTFWGVK